MGNAAAAAMIAARTDDGRFGPFRFAVGILAGRVEAGAADVRQRPGRVAEGRQAIPDRSSSQFRSKGPLPLASRSYAREFEEVKSFGSPERRPQREAGTGRQVLGGESTRDLEPDLPDALGTGGTVPRRERAVFRDALLDVRGRPDQLWDDKAHRSFWRPITAIREADTDGNRNTEPDAGWLPLIPTPPYPDHPSGHTGLSGSIVETLQRVLRDRPDRWSDTNNAGLTRSFTRFSQAIDEIVDARVWSGIHFRTADEQGERIGKHVARYREQHYFEPKQR